MGKRITDTDVSIAQYFKDIQNCEQLDKEEELSLIKEAQSGDVNALNRVVVANLKLVTKLASQYKHPNIAYLDFVQVGNIALRNAVLKYDVTSSNKFSAYAGRVIKTSFRDELDKEGRTVRLPANICRKITKYRKWYNRYLVFFEWKPNDEDLLDFAEGDLTIDDILDAKEFDKEIVYLDAPYGFGEESGPLYNFIADPNLEEDSFLFFHDALENLGEKDKNVIMNQLNEGDSSLYPQEEVDEAQATLKKVLLTKYGNDLHSIGY